MKMRLCTFCLAFVATLLTVSCRQETSVDAFSLVNPMIGTGAHYSADAAELWGKGDTIRKQKPIPTSKRGTMAGYPTYVDPGQCIPAVLAPNGMTCWTPQTEDTEQKGISPYYYADTDLQGFRASHWISGSMTQDYGSFTIMPLNGALVTNPLARGSNFSHETETATPAYYSVEIKDYGIKAEMTGCSRSAILKFTYLEAGDAWLVVNPNSDEGQGCVAVNNATGLVEAINPVHRIYQGAGQYAGFNGYLVLKTDKLPLDAGVYAGDSILTGAQSVENRPEIGAWLKYHVEAGETIEVRVATSFTSLEAAQNNMRQELDGRSFEEVRRALEQKWRERLGKIEVKSQSVESLQSFYTALYHASFLPRTLNDCDGSYPSFGGDGAVQHTDITYYDDFSMWDTYRALHPLLCLIEPQMEGEMVQSLIEKYKQGGWLPIFPCWNSYTSEMIGDHTASLVADAWFKDIRNFEAETAAEALLQNAYLQPNTRSEYEEGKGRRALDSYLKYGYIPLEDPVSEAYHKAEQTSRTLEYAYDDYVLSNFVRDMGYFDEADDLLNRSQNFRNVFNPNLGWVDGRHIDGSWAGGDPYQFQKYICEGKPCHYSWYVPHDVLQLITLMGGKEAFEMKLDSLFEGGHYWHGNEPCHQIAYLYNYIGKPEKAQQRVAEILCREYGATADGLAGNDDAGQMSAWYVLSSIGIYPVCPGLPNYALIAPSFDEVTMHFGADTQFRIVVNRASENDNFVTSATLNGEPYDLSFINHSDIVKGGLLEISLGPNP